MRFKTLIRYPIDIRRARHMLASRDQRRREFSSHAESTGHRFLTMPQTDTCRAIVLDLQSTDLLFDCGRHLMTFAYWSAAIGSKLYFRCRPIVLSAMARKFHGRELLAETDAQWIDASQSEEMQNIPDDALVLSDSSEPDPIVVGGNRRWVRMLIGRDIDSEIPIMPYPMHPWTLRALRHGRLTSLRKNERHCRIFFAGNQKPKYGNDKMLHEFGVHSRLSLLQTLRENFGPRIQYALDLENQPLVVLLDSRSVSIAADQWLPALSHSDFFLCCPGAAQPMCHNLVESMAVGTIPILEYSHRLSPQLIDGENAICFRGLDGLIEAVARVDAMPPAEVRRMRLNAAQYYDEHLQGERFLRGIRDGEIDVRKQRVCMPFHEHNLYDAEGDLVTDVPNDHRRAA